MTARLIDSATAAVIERISDHGTLRVSSDAEIRALLGATLGTIIEIGSLDPPVRDILGRSGLSRQVLYRYFGSKDELLLVTFAAGWRLVAGYIDRLVAAADSPADELRAWIAGVMRQAESAEVGRLTKPFAFTGHRLEQRYPSEYAEARQTLVGSLERIIADGVSAGAFTTDQPDQDALVLYDAVFARQHRYVVLDEVAPVGDVDVLHRFALRAVGARSHSPAASRRT